MERFALNGLGIMLDDQLKEVEIKQANANAIIYNQFLKQLHLPFEKWQYESESKGKILIEKLDELEQMDFLLFKQLDYAKLVSPLRLYTYYLLQQLLGNKINLQGIGVLRERKNRFMFLNVAFNLTAMNEPNFETNNLSRFLIKKAEKADLILVHETFFELINTKFSTKLLNALIQFQALSGTKVNKTELIETVLNENRLMALKAFSLKLIE